MHGPQNFKNHTRFDPLFHFTIVPLLLITLIAVIHQTVHDGHRHHGGHLLVILIAVLLILIAGMARSSALRAQDRAIRLEERIRYAAVLGPAELPATAALSLRQIIALRFASDAELSGLITRVLSQQLTPKQIKQSIISWRPDYDRV